MTTQRKNYILRLFKKNYSKLISKVADYKEIEKVRIIAIRQFLGKYDCFLYYDCKKELFTKIDVIEEIIFINETIKL